MQLLTAALLYAALASAQTTRYIFSFGDSYTSTNFTRTGTKPSPSHPFGNPDYPFPSGTTFSGGPNWIGHLVHDLAPKNTLSWNLAVGGAQINNTFSGGSTYDLVKQVNDFNTYVNKTNAPWTAANSAFIFYFGTNDINALRTVWTGSSGKGQAVINEYFRLIQILYKAGGRKFVVFMMDPLDQAPTYKVSKPSQVQSVQDDVASFNSLVTTASKNFVNSNTGASMQLIDTPTVWKPILANATAYGAPNNTCTNPDGTSCLWHDDLHPGLQLQNAMGNAVYSTLNSTGFWA